ncbi:ImmA/IrrE family metallo-endopeptidase [Mycolicibacterium sp. lyk4-40-TYG-92]|uniref:ImmA/IrrE family metallo-endopeptidase n=1 Tax=Mycolicibacterium sp. lyk4-40-TYG-92 TaxID=3040295 RepID=UPI00254A3FBD|nr:ImmA/IrrE family metallo-endopeptidase [Mycolicibacterium sp. lyk4-40-TYG-92]
MDLDRATELALGLLGADVRTRFAADPVDALRNTLELKVQPVEHLAQRRDDGGACDGVSYLQDGVILYAPTRWSKRQNFTLAHELAHWLIEQQDELYDWLADQPEPQRMLETLCDRIAQRLLLPEALIDSVVGAGPVRASHVINLFNRSEASGPVCAIALARRLTCCGSVLLIDRVAAVVSYASLRPDVEEGWPNVFPWPGNEVPAGHPFLNMRSGDSWTRRSYWRARWGTQRDYYADAVCEGTRVIAILADLDVWNAEQLHIDQPNEFDRRPSSQITCCGRTFTVRGYPCDDCGQQFCPSCKRCNCDRRAEREESCTSCYLKFQRHLLVAGLCEDCR